MTRPSFKRASVVVLLLTLLILGLVACGGEEAKLTQSATLTNTLETPEYTQTPSSLPMEASLIITPNAVEPGGNIEILGA